MVRDPKNIKDTLIRTKMSERGGDPSKHKKECINVVPPVCSDWKTIRAKATSEVVNINTNVSCKYHVSDQLWPLATVVSGDQYIGETEKSLALDTLFSQHQGYVNLWLQEGN